MIKFFYSVMEVSRLDIAANYFLLKRASKEFNQRYMRRSYLRMYFRAGGTLAELTAIKKIFDLQEAAN